MELLIRQLVRRMALRLAEDLEAAGKVAATQRAQQASAAVLAAAQQYQPLNQFVPPGDQLGGQFGAPAYGAQMAMPQFAASAQTGMQYGSVQKGLPPMPQAWK